MTHKSLGRLAFLFYAVLVLAIVQCAGGATEKGGSTMAINLTSSAFEEGQPIPSKFTCEGANASPPLEWSNIPHGAKSLALICDDPDAPMGTWVHWVLYGLSPGTTGLPEAVPGDEIIEGGAAQGKNDFKQIGYGGPCPPPGKPHRYYFKLYALDTELNLKPGATKKDLESSMKGHIVAQGQLVGTYKR